jgi:hypothetical protein
MALVTPAAFANALRIVGEIPDDASPLFMEQWIARYATVRVNAAPEELPGWNHKRDGKPVIETGRGRSPEERNLTLVHEFGECLRESINAELESRGLSALTWEERYWDGLAVEIVAPLASFRRAARENGLDVIDLFKPLSFEGVVRRMKESFDQEVPLFVVYAKDAAWRRGGGHEQRWTVATSAWTKQWMGIGYRGKRELIPLPRRGISITPGSFVDDVRRRNRALLVHALVDSIVPQVQAEVLLRPRAYGRDVAQVFAVGVERRYGNLLSPQIQLVGPEERSGRFEQLF